MSHSLSLSLSFLVLINSTKLEKFDRSTSIPLIWFHVTFIDFIRWMLAFWLQPIIILNTIYVVFLFDSMPLSLSICTKNCLSLYSWLVSFCFVHHFSVIVISILIKCSYILCVCVCVRCWNGLQQLHRSIDCNRILSSPGQAEWQHDICIFVSKWPQTWCIKYGLIIHLTITCLPNCGWSLLIQ